jgi:hypothetical protein
MVYNLYTVFHVYLDRHQLIAAVLGEIAGFVGGQ